MIGGLPGPKPRVPASEFALRLVDEMRAQLPQGNTTALDVVRSMGEPELIDVFCALAVGAATHAWAARPRAPWHPIVDPAPELALASTVLHYAYWGDVEALGTAVRQASGWPKACVWIDNRGITVDIGTQRFSWWQPRGWQLFHVRQLPLHWWGRAERRRNPNVRRT